MNNKRVIAKNTLSFSCSKSMKYLRCPPKIWTQLKEEFNFTIDLCASDDNHLLDRYYTINDNCLEKDWTNEIGFLHPLFDSKIGKFIEKAHNSVGLFVILIPASTHTKYFHEYLYKKDNVEIRFLRKPVKGFRFGKDDGSADEPNKIGYIKSLMVCVMDNRNKD
tara:strand:+ start:545 stop:1036 length:492 start_codon:yes stop_codon:yes gene_type:complete